jgi:egghead protein (zeste-white 4 protein)
MHEPWIGMHGSFVVCPNAVEQLIGFDHGIVGSITEDTYFALLARTYGIGFAWIDAVMFEQSPFTLADFVRQRSRWFVGLWLIVLCQTLQLKRRFVLGLMMVSWMLTPPVCIAIYSSWLIETSVSGVFSVCLATVGALALWGYLLGFWFTFSATKEGWVWYVCLLVVQVLLLPVFAVMEMAGVAHGTWKLLFRAKDFYVVKKEEGDEVRCQAIFFITIFSLLFFCVCLV